MINMDFNQTATILFPAATKITHCPRPQKEIKNEGLKRQSDEKKLED